MGAEIFRSKAHYENYFDGDHPEPESVSWEDE
jgi:hypothetical protein